MSHRCGVSLSFQTDKLSVFMDASRKGDRGNPSAIPKNVWLTEAEKRFFTGRQRRETGSRLQLQHT